MSRSGSERECARLQQLAQALTQQAQTTNACANSNTRHAKTHQEWQPAVSSRPPPLTKLLPTLSFQFF